MAEKEKELDKDLKHWIDNATYTQLLARWRHAPSGDPIFVAELGAYYSKVMRERLAKLDPGEHVRISKHVGW